MRLNLNVPDDDDAVVQKVFTAKRLAHIAKSDAEIDAGEFFTSAQVDEHFRQKLAGDHQR